LIVGGIILVAVLSYNPIVHKPFQLLFAAEKPKECHILIYIVGTAFLVYNA